MQSMSAIDDQSISQYRRDGYLVLRDLLGQHELSSLRRAFASLAHDDAHAKRFKNSLIVVRNLWRRDPEMRSLTWSVAKIAARLLGTSCVQLIDDNAFIKPPRLAEDNPTGWHQDSPNFPFDRRGFLTIWVALEDISEDDGALTFLPGAHRLGPFGAFGGDDDEVPLDAILQPEDYAAVRPPKTEPLSAGDASVHDGYMLHCAGPNKTGRERRAWAARFIPPSTLYTGVPHRSFDNLGLVPFQPIRHDDFPLIEV